MIFHTFYDDWLLRDLFWVEVLKEIKIFSRMAIVVYNIMIEIFLMGLFCVVNFGVNSLLDWKYLKIHLRGGRSIVFWNVFWTENYGFGKEWKICCKLKSRLREARPLLYCNELFVNYWGLLKKIVNNPFQLVRPEKFICHCLNFDNLPRNFNCNAKYRFDESVCDSV